MYNGFRFPEKFLKLLLPEHNNRQSERSTPKFILYLKISVVDISQNWVHSMVPLFTQNTKMVSLSN